jgi:hypothetical protein
MVFDINCVDCEWVMRLKDDLNGKTIRCPDCGLAQRVEDDGLTGDEQWQAIVVALIDDGDSVATAEQAGYGEEAAIAVVDQLLWIRAGISWAMIQQRIIMMLMIGGICFIGYEQVISRHAESTTRHLLSARGRIFWGVAAWQVARAMKRTAIERVGVFPIMEAVRYTARYLVHRRDTVRPATLISARLNVRLQRLTDALKFREMLDIHCVE